MFIKLRVFYFIFYCIKVLPACMFVSHMCAGYPQRPEEGIRSPGTRVTDGWGLPCGAEGTRSSWKISQGLPQGLLRIRSCILEIGLVWFSFKFVFPFRNKLLSAHTSATVDRFVPATTCVSLFPCIHTRPSLRSLPVELGLQYSHNRSFCGY